MEHGRPTPTVPTGQKIDFIIILNPFLLFHSSLFRLTTRSYLAAFLRLECTAHGF